LASLLCRGSSLLIKMALRSAGLARNADD
jgi:hypothetical protein